MKKLLFLIVLLCAIRANAQNYLISFAGTGGSATVSSVKVENLTAGTSLIVNGSDILRLTITTGVDPVEKRQPSELKIYPNPTTGISSVEIFPPVAGDAIITVFDMTGKLMAQSQSYLENSTQEFRLSGINSGIYLISVKGNAYQYSAKLLSNSKATGKISIDNISNNQVADENVIKTDSKGIQATVDMVYSAGNRLKFTGISGIYSTVMTDIPSSDKTITFNFIACTDGDNNNYPVVIIGSQIWMAENLKTTKYKDGSSTIPLVTDDATWFNLLTPGFCWYGNNEAAFKALYGALYNWWTVSTGNLCPTGWHVPTDPEWTTLTTFLGDPNIAGGKLKEKGLTHWNSPNTDATNETGFTALPGGYRNYIGPFYYVGNSGVWWGSTPDLSYRSWSWYLFYDAGNVSRSTWFNQYGFSVRCIKD